jgi:acyl-CoA synthetase (AMP-forming)/AMP-acid ligase II
MRAVTSSANIADALTARAREAPQRVAIHYPRGRDADGAPAYASLTYAELEREVESLAAGLRAIGIASGIRAALMVKPGPEFFALMFALFRAGAVPVLIDPGIDRRALRECLAEAAPQAFIGIPLAHAARIALGWARASVRTLVTVGRRWCWGGWTYRQLVAAGADSLEGRKPRHVPVGVVVGAQAPTDHVGASAPPTGRANAAGTLAAILFTSGSTGTPKGVEYTHAHFAAQVELIRTSFDIRPGEIDLPTFAPFALFDPALGMTAVLPAIDYARPGRADPRVLAAAIARFGATTMFGSPAVLDVLARHGAPLAPTLRRVISAGAPVRPAVVAAMQRLLPDGARLWTPYGATECLPVALVDERTIAATRARSEQGAGICIGRPLAANRVRLIRIDDAPIERWSDELRVADGSVGEITVAGPTATRRYFRRDAATRAAKIDEDGVVVHRMGDLGYLDGDGLLWYVGRKSHRVDGAAGILFPEMVEAIFNTHPSVRRSALVGVGARGAQRPVLCVELDAGVGARAWPRLRHELLVLGAACELTRGVRTLLHHPRLPVDVRHNAKIARERLAAWAAIRLGATA